LKTSSRNYELDELYWFIGQKGDSETRENVYIMTMISRELRQIVGYSVGRDKYSWRIQEYVDSAPAAENYYSDGYIGYLDVVYPGKYIRNIHDKKDTHHIESVNADIRHFISGLARRSRCFYRSIETLDAVFDIFVDAYNKYGAWKYKYRKPVIHKDSSSRKHLHHWRDTPLSFLDFLDVS